MTEIFLFQKKFEDHEYIYKSYVVTAEWPRDGREENGDIWLCKIKWKNPNKIMTVNGFERTAN